MDYYVNYNDGCEILPAIISALTLITILAQRKAESRQKTQERIHQLRDVTIVVKSVKADITCLKRYAMHNTVFHHMRIQRCVKKLIKSLELTANDIEYQERELYLMLGSAIALLSKVVTGDSKLRMVFIDDTARILEDIIEYILNEQKRLEGNMEFP